MTKTTLLTAASVAVVLFAGAANAQEITSAKVSSLTVFTAGATPVVTPLTVATESNVGLSANRITNSTANGNEIVFRTAGLPATPTVSRPLAAGTYRVTLALTGTANPVFSAAIPSTALTFFEADGTTLANAACTTGQTISANGLAGQNTVSIDFTVAVAGCVAPPHVLKINPAYEIQSLGTVTASIAAAVQGAVPAAADNVFGAAASTVSLIRATAGYRVFVDGATGATNPAGGVDDGDLATILALGTGVPFRTLSGDDIIGGLGAIKTTVTAATAAGGVVYANVAAAALPAIRYNVAVNATNGNFAAIVPALRDADTGGTVTALTLGTPNTSAAASSPAGVIVGAQNVVVSIPTAQTASISSAPLTYSATVTPVIDAAGQTLVAQPGAVTASLQTIGIDGTNFIAPWFSGSQAQTQSVVRLSNTGTTAVSVRLTLTNGVFNFNGVPTTFTEKQCADVLTLPVDGDLVINSTTANNCFGNFTRGDLLITVQSNSGNVTAKMRNTSANGTFETTLGRYSGATAADAAN